ncbi:MAG: class I SAM-dependent methyltransferase [Proteobacteria bacterium]|nr:class I SAM-dependent methyltransferase [Pseudomonadota bacterium]MBI3497756.1 class I SAM-dependent methyltransferase [Pseudomonadota bacterium]
MLGRLPPNLRVLDVGCGPGMQTLELARLTQGPIAALDTHRPFLDELRRRAGEAGFHRRIMPVNAAMASMPFAAGSFDLIWSEGAMYIMGFSQALHAWKALLRDAGQIVVTEPCWLKADLPSVVREHWAEYPAMTTIEGCLCRIEAAGYRGIGHFTLPERSWWDDYYGPKEQRLFMLREKYAGDEEVLSSIDKALSELDVHRRYGSYYGYVFFAMRCEST